jgi:FAD/FMN-containing dehydrogenase
MPSRDELNRLSQAQNELVAAARRELTAFVGTLPADPARAAREIERFFPALVRTYGDAGAAVAAEWFEQTAKGTSRVVLGSAVAQAQAEATARWAARNLFLEESGSATALRLLLGATQRYVRQPGRQTIRRSAERSGARYARVTDGSACAFCALLAGRGAVYETRATAGDFDDYHDDCGCEITAVWSDDDLPEGYDPEALFALYQSARDEAGGSTKAILAAMRRQHGMR